MNSKCKHSKPRLSKFNCTDSPVMDSMLSDKTPIVSTFCSFALLPKGGLEITILTFSNWLLFKSLMSQSSSNGVLSNLNFAFFQ